MTQDGAPHSALSRLVVPLLKGVIYREADPRRWQDLAALAPRVRDYVGDLGLDLVLDDAEGYAFLRSTPNADAPDEDGQPAQPRLIARRQLSFYVSLLLALLRRKLAEFDAGGEATRLILSREQIVDMLRVFLPETSNEARLIDQIDTHLNRIVELGFLRRLKPPPGVTSGTAAGFEVRRIIRAFVDAQWLADFDDRLAQYQRHLAGGQETEDA